jgi:hypothetical protein
MDTPSSSMRDLARRLLEASRGASDPREPVAARVSETFRVSLTRFAGADGFTSLLKRAVALASEEVPSLQGVKVGLDGRPEGLEKITADDVADKAAVAITAHLLGLLVTFIGEPFTLRLVREAWPGTPLGAVSD